MTDLNTHIDGSPESLRAAASWIQTSFGSGAGLLADRSITARNDGSEVWTGPSSEAFVRRARALGASAEEAEGVAQQVYRQVHDLAGDFESAINEMGRVRSTARSSGLSVVGEVVINPGDRLVLQGSPPGPDATPAEHNHWTSLSNQVTTQNAKVDAFELACLTADEVYQRLVNLVDNAAASWSRHSATLAGLAAEFLTAGISAAVVMRIAPALVAQSKYHWNMAEHNAAGARALRTPDGRVLARESYYRNLDEARSHLRDARKYDHKAQNVRVPRSLGRALGVLGIVATGYAIREDMEAGESAGQAITSNVGGMVAGMAAGAATGAVIGSFIPVPGVGTAVGIIGGAIVGTVVGAFTSGVIDSMWENGVTAVGDAVSRGWDEVKDVGSAVGDLASGAWNALFG